MISRRRKYDVIKSGPAWSSDVIHGRGAFINGEYVPIKGARLVPHVAPAQPTTRKETNSKPRSQE